MIDTALYAQELSKRFSGIFGVPDSLLKDLNREFGNFDSGFHQIAANEGSAIALATGRFLASSIPSVVYLQNSGLGNCVNPILSLAHSEVYGIPMVLIIGWRGEPGLEDEPQHLVQGRQTEALLQALGVPFEHIAQDNRGAISQLGSLEKMALDIGGPVALLVPKKAFAPSKKSVTGNTVDSRLSRETALAKLLELIPSLDCVVATTGMLGRELFELRGSASETLANLDFLNIGAMGHAVSISLGIATGGTSKTVWCLDGDGSVIMHTGALATVGDMQPKNFVHILFNNGVHDSVGGQPTPSKNLSFCELAKACGYKNVSSVSTEASIAVAAMKALNSEGPTFIEILIKPGNRSDLGRPTKSPIELKEIFMKNFSNDSLS